MRWSCEQTNYSCLIQLSGKTMYGTELTCNDAKTLWRAEMACMTGVSWGKVGGECVVRRDTSSTMPPRVTILSLSHHSPPMVRSTRPSPVPAAVLSARSLRKSR